MDKMQTLHSFWSGFGLMAYDENTVPDNAQLPYITYEASDDDFGNPLYLTANVWYRSSSWTEVTAKEKEISNYITRGGKTIPYDGGLMWIQKRNPWAQRLTDSSNYDIRRIVLNVTVEFLN